MTGLFELLLRNVAELIERAGGITGAFRPLTPRTVAQLQALASEGVMTGPAIAFCSNETGGATIAFYDPTASVWKRVTDNATIS